MAESFERYLTYVQQLETQARKSPGIFRFRAIMLVLLGQVYISSVLMATGVLLIGVLCVFVGICHDPANFYKMYWLVRLSIPLGIATFVLLRAVCTICHLFITVQVGIPEGIVLQQRDAPRLLSLVGQFRSRLKTPPIHRVVLMPGYNAGIYPRPRLGMLGWYEYYVHVGLALMLALSPEQFRAVIAHEMGHVSTGQMRFSRGLTAYGGAWSLLLERLECEDGLIAGIIRLFIHWYLTRLSAFDLVLRRSREYEADRVAARLCGKEHYVAMLINMEIKGAAAANVIRPPAPVARAPRARNLAEPCDEEEAPIETPVESDLSNILRGTIPVQESDKWLNLALEEQTAVGDSHPCLADRLSALGYPRQMHIENAFGQRLTIPPPLKEDAAEYFLGEHFTRLAEALGSLRGDVMSNAG